MARFVALGPMWQGTGGVSTVQWTDSAKKYGLTPVLQATIGRSCAACLEYTTGSDFVNEFGAGGPYAPGVAYTNIATRYDEYVFPYTSGLVPGTDTSNIVVQDHCPADHSEDDALASSPVAAAYSLNALDPTHPRPVPCLSVAPFTGTPVG